MINLRPSCGNCYFSESLGATDTINCTHEKPYGILGGGGPRDCMEVACGCWLPKIRPEKVERFEYV